MKRVAIECFPIRREEIKTGPLRGSSEIGWPLGADGIQ